MGEEDDVTPPRDFLSLIVMGDNADVTPMPVFPPGLETGVADDFNRLCTVSYKKRETVRRQSNVEVMTSPFPTD